MIKHFRKAVKGEKSPERCEENSQIGNAHRAAIPSLSLTPSRTDINMNVMASADSGYKSADDQTTNNGVPNENSINLPLIMAISAHVNNTPLRAFMSPRVSVHSSRRRGLSAVSGQVHMAKWGSYMDIISESVNSSTEKRMVQLPATITVNDDVTNDRTVDNMSVRDVNNDCKDQQTRQNDKPSSKLNPRSPVTSLPSYSQCCPEREYVTVRLQSPRGSISDCVIARWEDENKCIAQFEPHPVFPINACGLQVC